MTPVLDVQKLAYGYGEHRLIDGLTFSVGNGRHSLLLGPSGSGKSTLLALIAGLLTPDAGKILVAGTDIGAASAVQRDAMRRGSIGVVFQSLRLVSALTVRGNLILAQRLAGQREDVQAADELLGRFGIAHRAHVRPRELSQGEAQRAAVARALVAGPSLLLADEPTSALDDDNAVGMIRLLLDSATTAGATLLVATHDSRVRYAIQDAVVLSPVRQIA